MSSPPKGQAAKAKAQPQVPFTVLPSRDGFQVYRINVPGSLFEVSGSPDNPNCNCPEFIWRPEPEHRCTHTQAVFRYLHGHPGMKERWWDRLAEEEEDVHHCGDLDILTIPATVCLVRQVSRDGSLDTLSIQFSMDTGGLSAADAVQAMQELLARQEELAASFTISGGGRRPSPQLHGGAHPHLAVTDEPVPAILREVGGIQTAAGRRHFLNVEVDGSRHKLFGTLEELEEHLARAGFSYPELNLAEGLIFDAQCRVVLVSSDCGRYLNVKKLLAAKCDER